MPLLREKEKLQGKWQDIPEWHESNEVWIWKTFKDDMKRITGGLQIVTCTCSRKIMYSLKKLQANHPYLYKLFCKQKPK